MLRPKKTLKQKIMSYILFPFTLLYIIGLIIYGLSYHLWDFTKIKVLKIPPKKKEEVIEKLPDEERFSERDIPAFLRKKMPAFFQKN